MDSEAGLGRTLILGLGRSGAASARYLAARLASGEVTSVTAVDEGSTPALERIGTELEALGVRVALGVESVGGEFDLCVASPGIAPTRPISVWSKSVSKRVISEIEFAFERSTLSWIAITGTNGKTTTTGLIGHLLVEAGISTEVVGNIGRPAIEIADGASSGTVLVAEVSSFQLALIDRFRPRVAVLLNITPDHVDWHGSLEAYAADKVRVFENQRSGDFAVIDVDDPGSAPYADAVESRGVRVMRVSRGSISGRGAEVCDDVLVLRTPHGPVDLIHRDELLIRGDHNVSNALAAAAAAYCVGAPIRDLRAALATFQPIEHRLEPVGEVDGVEYVNDSKATNPDAVIKALTAFGDRSLIVLLGGRNKGNDFTELADAVAQRAHEVVVFGEAAPELEPALRRSGVQPRIVEGFKDAVMLAREVARPGDAVLLSPACASFDEFSGYEERGDTFRALVQDMSERGSES